MTTSRIILTLRMAMIAVLLAVAVPAVGHAMTVDEAESQGLVGELRNGYLGVVRNDPGVQDLVNRVNAARRAQYQNIANQRGISLQAVEALVGKKLIEKANSGEIVQGSDGSWVKKP